jgi:hypothetical protein
VSFDVRGKLLSWKRGEGTEKIRRTSTEGATNNNEKKHHALEIGDGRARLSMDNYLTMHSIGL